MSTLERKIQQTPEGSRLLHQLDQHKARVSPLLARIVVTFPEFTDHDIKHSEEVISILGWLIPETLRKKLNAYEIYFLLSAAYFHDLGMVNLPELSTETNRTVGAPASATPDVIRDTHHTMTETWLLKNFKDVGIEDVTQAGIIARICRGHRREDLNDSRLFNPELMYRSNPINVQLLSALLRIADELDLTSSRTPMIVYEHIPPKETISRQEWDRHLSVSGVALSPDDPLIIKCSATCQNPRIHRSLKRLESKINREIDGLPDYLHHFREFRRDLPRRFVVDITAVGYQPRDFRFSLSERNIVTLLMGEKLYSRKEEGIRELLKNAVDTCRLKRSILETRGQQYSPRVVFEMSPNGDQLIVSDNGMGMDDEIVERYFTKIGESFYKSTEFLNSSPGFTPVSELGIGILSCFMLADRITVESKTKDSGAIRVEIDDLSDYFMVLDGDMQDEGTSIILSLKSEVQNHLNLLEEVKRYARHVEFPVVVRDRDGQENKVEDVGSNAYLKSTEDPALAFHEVRIAGETCSGVVAIALEKDDRFGVHAVGWRGRNKIFEKSPEHMFVSYEGIFVGNGDLLTGVFHSELFFVDVDLRANAIELNAARNAIVDNSNAEEIRRNIADQLFSSFETLLQPLCEKSNKTLGDGYTIANAFFERYFVGITRDYQANKDATDPRFLNLVRKYYTFECMVDESLQYLRQAEIVAKRKAIVRVTVDVFFARSSWLAHILKNCTGFRGNLIYVMSHAYGIFGHDYVKPIFVDVYYDTLTSIMGMTRVDGLAGMVPKSWRVAKFSNYETHRLMEFDSYPNTIINAENKFVDLLLRVSNKITANQKLAVQAFFRNLKYDMKKGLEEVVSKQKEILNALVEAGLLSLNQQHEYLLTMEDFAPGMVRQ